MKQYGRLVRNFNDDECIDIKFSQNRDLRDKLLSTGKSLIVEGAYYDKLWGSGLDVSTTILYLTEGKMLPGQNLLGRALMEVREELSK